LNGELLLEEKFCKKAFQRRGMVLEEPARQLERREGLWSYKANHHQSGKKKYIKALQPRPRLMEKVLSFLLRE
jgi:hypothetical protein